MEQNLQRDSFLSFSNMSGRLTEADICIFSVVYLQQRDTSTLKLYILLKLSSCANGLSFPPETHSRDASMGFVVMMERGWQGPDLETLLPRRPLKGPKAAVDSQLMPFG